MTIPVPVRPGTPLDDVTVERRFGVIDIGSNSIRLVIFQGHPRAPTPLFNEKVLCGLGRSLAATGKLDAEGVELALENVPRFTALARTMGVEDLHVLATAAVRDAEDGPRFAATIERRCGVTVRVLGGDEEARLSAYGVIAGHPRAEGVMGDLGGGSLELVSLHGGETAEHVTLPLGPFRLREEARRGTELVPLVMEHLSRLGWLGAAKGREFYAVGGSWRALARIHMAQGDYPLRIIDRYTVSRGDMDELAEVIERLSGKSLEKLPGVPKRRLEVLPMAAMLMRRIIAAAKPERIVFSAQGLREGVLYAELPPELRAVDPLHAGCRSFARRMGRFDGMEDALTRWTAPLFPDESPEQTRLRRAACIIGDLGWTVHPGYRAEHGLERALTLTVAGIDHPGRAYFAVAAAARYGGAALPAARRAAAALGLDEAGVERATQLGRALRLAYGLSGGAPAVLASSPLSLQRKSVTLTVVPEAAPLVGEMVERRLREVASAFGRRHQIAQARKTSAKAS
jgi:exopolyphosphatase/guanosine-5'-triphosphate,3'-diphosphate pyrophosphatase